ncbi:MAG: hypothetical protein JO020_04865 [Chloroflexi bacterium]|nr:hypothetical protein [Chloroflexota bacterium]
MAVALPILALIAWVVALSQGARSWRDGVLAGAVAWGVALVAITEVLSLFQALTPIGLTLAWSLVLLLVTVCVARRRASGLAFPPRPVRHLDPVSVALVVWLTVEVTVLAGIAIISPPNTWDSMSYHMARLIHWQESGSVAPYPAYVLRQLYMPPGAEFVMLHLQILTGGDALANLVQWAAMLGSVVGVSLIARELGAGRAGQVGAAVFAASLPIGVLEATSTQNDHALAFWLVCTVAFGLRLMTEASRSTAPTFGASLRGSSWSTALLFGASLGLALLTKATGYVWAAPLLVWVAASVLLRQRSPGLALVTLSGLVALAINAGMYTRNIEVFGQPLGQTDEGLPSLRYLNDTFEPGLFAGTLARDLGINFVATPWAEMNMQAEGAVAAFHTWLGVDLTDPRTTWSGERFRAQSTDLAYNESFASNPVHLVVIGLALVGALGLPRVRATRGGIYATVVVAGMLLFAALVRWQPWHTRLELPFFVLAAPVVGVVLERVSTRLTYLAAAALLVYMVPYVISNDTRSLTGARSILTRSRTDQYFTNWPELRPQYLTAIKMLADEGCTRIGFAGYADSWEYPLWALLPGVQEVQQVDVPNGSANLATRSEQDLQLCAVLALGPATGAQVIALDGDEYKAVWSAGKDLQAVALLTPSQAVQAP